MLVVHVFQGMGFLLVSDSLKTNIQFETGKVTKEYINKIDKFEDTYSMHAGLFSPSLDWAYTIGIGELSEQGSFFQPDFSIFQSSLETAWARVKNDPKYPSLPIHNWFGYIARLIDNYPVVIRGFCVEAFPPKVGPIISREVYPIDAEDFLNSYLAEADTQYAKWISEINNQNIIDLTLPESLIDTYVSSITNCIADFSVQHDPSGYIGGFLSYALVERGRPPKEWRSPGVCPTPTTVTS